MARPDAVGAVFERRLLVATRERVRLGLPPFTRRELAFAIRSRFGLSVAPSDTMQAWPEIEL